MAKRMMSITAAVNNVHRKKEIFDRDQGRAVASWNALIKAERTLDRWLKRDAKDRQARAEFDPGAIGREGAIVGGNIEQQTKERK